MGVGSERHAFAAVPSVRTVQQVGLFFLFLDLFRLPDNII
jgi:hypothetical protein